MKMFIPYTEYLKQILSKIIASERLHAKWLNTLSFLENCGARKIAACEHPTLVKEEMLKHAAEEFRHAHHLKKQIGKLLTDPMETYSPSHLLGGMATLHYLSALDLEISRYLKNLDFSLSDVKHKAYLLVTYAIELRAAELYPIYHELLHAAKSSVAVKSILLEENEHLEEMVEGLEQWEGGLLHAKHASSLESTLCQKWLNSIYKEIF
jgi:hypothetical protein